MLGVPGACAESQYVRSASRRAEGGVRRGGEDSHRSLTGGLGKPWRTPDFCQIFYFVTDEINYNIFLVDCRRTSSKLANAPQATRHSLSTCIYQ